MTCRRTRRLLSVQRELVAHQRVLVQRHLAGCPPCRAIAREYELMDRRLDRLLQPVPATSLLAAVQARTIVKEQEMKLQAISWRRRVLQGATLVALVALVFAAALLWRAQFSASVTEQPLLAHVGENVQLMGYDFEPGAPPCLILYWQASTEIDASYTVFVHLLDGDSKLWGQWDSPLGVGAGPSPSWVPGETVVHEYEIPISADAPSGDYFIEVGAYYTDTGQRLPVTDEVGNSLGDRLRLEGRFYWFSFKGNTASRFVWPTFGYLSQTYWDGHRAIDIASQSGTPVTAAADGTVVEVDHDADYGIHVLIDHGDGYTTFYAHLAGSGVKAGQEVRQKQQIGVVGSTGRSTGPHLHFEIRRDGVPLNPFETVGGEIPKRGPIPTARP